MIDFACKKFELDDVIKCGLMLSKSDLKIMYFLIRTRERFTSRKIARNLQLDLSTVQRSLKKLNEKGIVIRSQTNLINGGYVFSYQIKDKKELRRLIMNVINSWVRKVESELMRW